MDNKRRRRFISYFSAPPLRGDRAKLMAKTGLTKGRVSQFFDESQPFGEKAARNLALSLGLPEDYFETDRLAAPTPSSEVREESAPYLRAVAPRLRDALTVLGDVLAKPLPADVRRDAAYLLEQLATFSAVERHRQGLIDLLEPFAVNDSPTTETRGSTTVAPNQLDQDHAVSQTGGDHAPASSQVLGSGIQPEGGTEWKQRARHHGQDIKPISATTARRNQKKPGAKGHAK